MRSTSSVIGPSPGSSGPTISAAVDIGTVEAEVINATITATGVLNTLNATVGGVHGSVQVGAIEGQSEEVPDARFVAVSDTDDSTVRIEAATITGSIVVHSLDNAGDTAGIFAGEMNGWITVEGHVDTIDVDTLFPDYDSNTENPPLNKLEVGSIGHLKADVAGVPHIAAENALPDLRADAIGHVEVGTLHLGLRGLAGATCAVGVMECNGVISPITNEFDEGETITIALQDVERFDIGNDMIDTTLLIDDDGAGDAPLVRIGGSLRVSNVVETVPYVSFTGTAALRSNMVINAKNNAPQAWDFWESPVLPDGGLPSPTVLTAEYSELPGTFGGGAVGVVPFTVHRQQTDHLNQDTNDNWDILISEFLRDTSGDPVCTPGREAAVEWYGPVMLAPPPAGSTRAPLSVELKLVNGSTTYWSQQSQRMEFRVDPGNPRRVLIRGRNSAILPAGEYRVTTWPSPVASRVLCDNLLTTSDVSISPMTGATAYTFQLLHDCEPYDCEEETSPCGIEVPDWLCDSIDFNNDGLFPDTQDVDDFLSVFEGGSCSTGDCNDIDFNNDGLYPDTLDIDALLSVFEGGDCLF